jgi:rubrerythrin
MAPTRQKPSLAELNQRGRVRPSKGVLDEPLAIDHSRLFVCPTLTPLFYTAGYRELLPAQALRANQITALYFNELIGFFEKSLAPPLLAALSRSEAATVSPELQEALRRFAEEERRHSEMFRSLNRLSAPSWYARGDYHVLAVPRLASAVLRFLTRHPVAFPAVLFLMLAMEEHSIEVSRRCGLVAKERIEPTWAAVYRAHLEDEVRHVQMDWHLLDRFYDGRSAAVRRVNAVLLRVMFANFFLRPTRSGPRVVSLLVREFPQLAARKPRMVGELRRLPSRPEYVAMMYSRAATPVTFALFDRFPELRAMARVLTSYTPAVEPR